MEISKDKISFILQARAGSTRLPKKMILPFFRGKSIFEILIERITEKFQDTPIFLATSNDPENILLEKMAANYGIRTHKGSEDDVLSRFVEVSEKFGLSKIVRICADNPFLDILELNRLIDYAKLNNNYDYISFRVNDKPSILSHFGFWAEYTNIDALRKVSRLTLNKAIYREHVTNYLYSNSDIFNISLLDIPPFLEGKNNIRMTLDTQEDFDLLSEVYKNIHTINGNDFSIKDIIVYLDEHPYYKDLMKKGIKSNEK